VITILEAARGLQEESAKGFGRKTDFSVCGGPSELAMATSGAICPARPKSDFLKSLIFRVFQQYRSLPEIEGSRDVGFPPIAKIQTETLPKVWI
jgi:hypothetical protein